MRWSLHIVIDVDMDMWLVRTWSSSMLLARRPSWTMRQASFFVVPQSRSECASTAAPVSSRLVRYHFTDRCWRVVVSTNRVNTHRSSPAVRTSALSLSCDMAKMLAVQYTSSPSSAAMAAGCWCCVMSNRKFRGAYMALLGTPLASGSASFPSIHGTALNRPQATLKQRECVNEQTRRAHGHVYMCRCVCM